MPGTIWVDEARGFWQSIKQDGCVVEYIETAFIGGYDCLLAIEERAGFGYGGIGMPIDMLNSGNEDGWPSDRGYAAFYCRK